MGIKVGKLNSPATLLKPSRDDTLDLEVGVAGTALDDRREAREGTATPTPLPLDDGMSGYLPLNGRTISGNPAAVPSAGASTLAASSGLRDLVWQKGRSSTKLPARISTASSSPKDFVFLLRQRMQSMTSVAAARRKSPEAMPATSAVGKGCASLALPLTMAIDGEGARVAKLGALSSMDAVLMSALAVDECGLTTVMDCADEWWSGIKVLLVDRSKDELVVVDVARGIVTVVMADVTGEGASVSRETVAEKVISNGVVLAGAVSARTSVDDAVLVGWLATGHDGVVRPHGSKEQQPTKLFIAQSYQK